jgi:hypothetical protein
LSQLAMMCLARSSADHGRGYTVMQAPQGVLSIMHCLFRIRWFGKLHGLKEDTAFHRPCKSKAHRGLHPSPHSSLVVRMRLASVVTLASARMTSCEYSTPNAVLMHLAIRFACFSDQKRKSSAEGCELASMLSTSRLLGSTADAGRRDGSASRQMLMT